MGALFFAKKQKQGKNRILGKVSGLAGKVTAGPCPTFRCLP